MIPICKKLPIESLFVIFPTRGEKADLALNRHMLPYKEYVPGIIKDLNPSICIFGNDWGLEELLSIIEAKSLNIPTLGIQEGVILNLRGHILVSNNDPSYVQDKYLDTDYFFCLGRVFLPSLMRDNLLITGNPKFDTYDRLPFPDKQRILINCNFPYGVDEEHRRSWISDVVSACENLGLDYFISKHPRDFGEIDVDENKIVRSSSATIHEQIKSATAVISRASTILYESIAAGRKVVYYNPGIEALPIVDDFPKSTLIKVIKSEDLLDAINQTAINLDIDRQDYYVFRENHLGTSEKISTELCARGIISIIEGKFVFETNSLKVRPINDLSSGFIKVATLSMNNLNNNKWLRSHCALQAEQISELTRSLASESDKSRITEGKNLAIIQENNELKSRCSFHVEKIKQLTQSLASEVDKSRIMEEKNLEINQENLELQQELQRLTGFKYWIKRLLINLFLNKSN